MPGTRESWMPIPKSMKVIQGEDNSSRWQDFLDAFQDYALVDNLYGDKPAVQMAKFRGIFGEENRTIIRNLEIGVVANDAADPAGAKPCKQLEKTIEALSVRFRAHRNIIYQRYVLYRIKQNPGELAKDFFERVNKQVKKCDFGAEARQTLRDMLVLGTSYPKAQEACFREDHATLDANRALQIIEMFEDNEKTVKNIQEQQTAESTNVVRQQQNRHNNQRKCWNCGSNHPPRKCPAYNRQCPRCSKKGHFENFCRSYNNKPSGQRPRGSNSVNAVYDEEPAATEQQGEWSEEEQVYCLQRIGNKPTRKLFVNLNVKSNQSNRYVKLKTLLDTGATVNVMSRTALNELIKQKATATDINGDDRTFLKMYDRSITTSLGTSNITIIHNGKTHILTFQVIDSDVDTLLSARACLEMRLIQVSNEVECVNFLSNEQSRKLEKLTESYEDIFRGLGKLPTPVRLYIKPNAIPVQQPPRRMPVALVEPLIQRLREMEKAGIIEKIDYPTEWVSNIVPVHREGKKLRVCLDPHYLNKALERPRFPMPTLSDALHKLRNAKVFTAIDARDGFYQMELDEPSADATTFWSPLGRFRYRRCPQGISSAPEEYQKRQMQAYEDLKGVIVVADDTLVFGEGATMEDAAADHYRNLQALFERARRVGLKFNKEKLKLGVPEVKFLGHIISKDGLKVDPDKVEAILKMPRPTDVKGVQTFLGCVNYLLQFIPNLSEITEPLRKLTQTEKYEFAWQSQQEKAFEEIKRHLTQTPTLAYFDQTKPVVLQTDASDSGLGGLMLQDNKPVAYTSHTLSAAERNYAIIEKECLAILVACTKFDKYIYGLPQILVQTDHKPLEAIFSKPLDACPKRLQRMRLALQRYNIIVQYISGKTNFVADALSRSPLPVEHEDITELVRRVELERVEHRDPSKISDITADRIRIATKTDEELQAVIEAIDAGWSEKNPKILGYWNVRDELVHEKGMIYKGLAVVIPKALRGELLKKTHASHLGFDSMCRRAKDSLFWPGMKNEIRNLAATCDACQTYQPAQQREPLMGKPIPQRPWQVIHQDVFSWENHQYVVTVDGYSDFFELERLSKDTTAATLINKTKTLFARYGKPQEMHTDSDPRYLSAEFQKFLQQWQTAHKPSSPHNHQSNGKSENAVKAAKRLVKKCGHLGQCLEEALLEWRLTPQAEGLSPAEKFFGRRLASTIPTKTIALAAPNAKRIIESIEQRRLRQKTTYDKSARPLPPLTEGRRVRIQPSDYSHEWKAGTCVKRINPRTYRVITDEGTQLIRNRRFLAEVPPHQPATNRQLPIHRPPTTEQPPAPPTTRARGDTEESARTPRPSTSGARQPNIPSVSRPKTVTTNSRTERSHRAKTSGTIVKRITSKRPLSTPSKVPATRLRPSTPATRRNVTIAKPCPREISNNNNTSPPQRIALSSPTPMDVSINNNNNTPKEVRTSSFGRRILTPARLIL